MSEHDPEDNIVGISPLGGNAVEGTSSADAPIRDTSTRFVPLVLDSVTGEYVAEHRAVDQIDRELNLEDQERFTEEEEFRQNAGFRTIIT